MKLQSDLSDHKQNLIFARNGTGKSFIARALRLLDMSENHNLNDEEIPDLLVSEESRNGKGSFNLLEAQKCIGGFKLDAKSRTVIRAPSSYIFHVFSEDFVEAHIRNRLHELDGNITHEIIVGEENDEIDTKTSALHELKGQYETKLLKLEVTFDVERQNLKKNFNIAGSLGSYKSLSINTYFSNDPYVTPTDVSALKELLAQYDHFKSLPNDAEMPIEIDVSGLLPDTSSLAADLQVTTSPSAVANNFKELIQRDPSFIERGLALVSLDTNKCPFCTQTIQGIAKDTIEAYTSFFADEEAKHRKRLESAKNELSQKKTQIDRKRAETLEAKAQFDQLKTYFPSLRNEQTISLSHFLDEIESHINNLQEGIDEKLSNLSKPVTTPKLSNPSLSENLGEAASSNRKKYELISGFVADTKSERLKIQNSACSSLIDDFFQKNEGDIREIRKLWADITAAEKEIEALKKLQGKTASAREKVVETFQFLLKRFFQDLYTFDESAFSIRRKNSEIPRGPDRTLSDGEKSIIAFCYYIARIHLRVKTLADYKKVFLIIDDPVSSLSFDYIYGIAQCLKHLRLSNDGSIVMTTVGNYTRPPMLVLTHNDYFYNVLSSNNVMKPQAFFQLTQGQDEHRLKNQKAFAAPHLLHLKDVYEVAQRVKSPNHTTANSIRAVIEGMWKFCNPDINDFEAFIGFINKEHGIEIKSILINDLCHGGKFSDPPHREEELILAAEIALSVVEKFAPGQLKIAPTH